MPVWLVKPVFICSVQIHRYGSRFVHDINVVCCVGSVQIQIVMEKGWYTADMDSKV